MKWIVNIKGGPPSYAGEISVIQSTNSHGQRSYGWFDERKLLILSYGNPWMVEPIVWEKLILVAHKVADELNNKPPLAQK